MGYNNINQAASLELIAAMKGKSMVSIGMVRCELGVEGAQAMAELVSVTTSSVTVTDMRYNELDTESATMLANVAKEKGISLCGITPEQTEADFTPSKNSYNRIGPADAILLTADLVVRPSVTKILVSRNELGDEGATILCNALRESTVTKVEELDLSYNDIGPDGAKAIAALCAVCASLTSVR